MLIYNAVHSAGDRLLPRKVGTCKPQGKSRLIQFGLTSKAPSALVYFEVGHCMGFGCFAGCAFAVDMSDLGEFRVKGLPV